MRPWLFALLATLLFGCPEGPGSGDDDDDDSAAADDDDATPPVQVLIQTLDPTQNQSGVSLEANVSITFDQPDLDATVSLETGAGVEVPGLMSHELADTRIVFDPTELLAFETQYRVVVSWTHSESPLSYTFTTELIPEGIQDPSILVGRAYILDLAEAEILEPPNAQILLAEFLPPEPILISVGPESVFGEDEQPGVHIHGSPAATEDPPYEQIDCAETFSMTWGDDGDLGTGDDRPADFGNPEITIGPTNLSLTIQNVETNLSELIIAGNFAEDGTELAVTTFTGVLDTRTLSTAINPTGGPGVACELLLATVGTECRECGQPEPGEYCVDIVTNEMVLPEQPGAAFSVTGCADLIERYAATGQCAEAAASYDPNGGGFYELRPEYGAR